jgi:hypothetical protein
MLALRHRPRRVFQFFDGSQGTKRKARIMTDEARLLAELLTLVDELITRTMRLETPFYDFVGVADLVVIADEVERIRRQTKLKRFLKLELAGTLLDDDGTPQTPNVLSFKVWDPIAPKHGVHGKLTNNVNADALAEATNRFNLPTRRHILKELGSVNSLVKNTEADNESDGELNQTKSDKMATLEPSERKAYLAAKYAETMKGCQLQDPEAWEYLNEHGIGRDGGELENYTPPKRETFCDYMNRARRKLDEKRYTPRAGRAGTSRSIVKRSEI